jgi:hypothetical protein
MERTGLFPRNAKLFVLISIFALVGGYLYVMALTTGYRAFIYIHAGILFFTGAAIFLKRMKSFLIFSMLIGLAFGFGRHFFYEQFPFESTLFSAGLRLDAVEVVLIFCYVHWALNITQPGQRIHKITLGGKIGLIFLLWIGYVCFSSFLSATNLPYALYEVSVYVKGFLLYFYLINNINEHDELKIVVYALIASCVIQSLYLLFQYITKTSYTIQGDWIAFVGPEGFRSRGFYGSPDAHAVFLATIFPICLLAIYFVRDRAKRFLLVSCIALIFLGILLTKVRIAAAVLGISVIITLLMSYRRGWLTQGQILLTLAVAVVTVFVAVPVVYERFRYAAYGEERWPLIVTAYEMFKSNILLGVGANNYNFVVLKYIPPDLFGKWVYTVHNEYFLRLSETGVFGFLSYYYLLIMVTASFYKATFSKNRLVYIVACGLFASMIASFVHRLVSMYHYQQIFALQCTIYALSVILLTQSKNEKIPDRQTYP